MPKFKGEYKVLINRFEKEQLRLLRTQEKKLKPILKRKAIACGIDMINTQWSLSCEDEDRARFTDLKNFVNHLSSYLKIDLYFQVNEGKFYWL